MRLHLYGVFTIATLLGFSCCGGHAPLSRSESVGDLATDTTVDDVPVRGYLVEIETTTADYRGELLAVDADNLYILYDNHRTAIPRHSIQSVSLDIYESGSGTIGILTTAGTISTISHGGFLIISAPTWIISGIATSISESEGNDVEVSRNDLLDALYQYARFPQGFKKSGPAKEAQSEPQIAKPRRPSLKDPRM